MTGFLNELGKKLAERWVTTLLLPGLLWGAVAVLSVQLGWQDALNLKGAADRITNWANNAHTTGVILLILLAVLLTSAAAGLTSTALGYMIRHLWTIRGHWLPARWLIKWRQHRWARLDAITATLTAQAITTNYGATSPQTAREGSNPPSSPAVILGPPTIAATAARRDSISLEPPERPTWIADRWLANAIRIHRAYSLNINIAWPRLWAVLPEPLRADVASAQAAYTAASNLTAWGVLYILLGIVWWPAILIGVLTSSVSILRARTATTVLCQLIETATDLHTHTLAQQLAIPITDRPVADIGNAINAQLRKDWL